MRVWQTMSGTRASAASCSLHRPGRAEDALLHAGNPRHRGRAQLGAPPPYGGQPIQGRRASPPACAPPPSKANANLATHPLPHPPPAHHPPTPTNLTHTCPHPHPHLRPHPHPPREPRRPCLVASGRSAPGRPPQEAGDLQHAVDPRVRSRGRSESQSTACSRGSDRVKR